MHEWSWFRVQTPGDGNCAFHALAQNMKRLRYIWTIMNWDDTMLATLPMSASAWRHACVSFIEKYAVILDINKKMSQEAAKKSFDRACRLEAEFMEYFSSIVEGENIDAIYDKVKQIIIDHSSKTIWVPSNENF